MPAYDRPLVINVPGQERRGLTPKSIGAVVRFSSHDLGRVQAWLNRAAMEGIIAPSVAQTYDETHGEPVWYVP